MTMKLNRKGCTRLVFEFENIVIKIPNFTYSWRHFIKGILDNMTENDTWRFNSGRYENGKSHLLCPVLWYMKGGFMIVMKRADTSIWTIDKMMEFMESENHWEAAGFGGDHKPDNYGMLNGKIVKLDYGN